MRQEEPSVGSIICYGLISIALILVGTEDVFGARGTSMEFFNWIFIVVGGGMLLLLAFGFCIEPLFRWCMKRQATAMLKEFKPFGVREERKNFAVLSTIEDEMQEI